MIRVEHLAADVLGLSPVVRAALSGTLDPALLHVPRKLDAFPMPEDRLDVDARRELAGALESNLAQLAPHVAVLENARALGKPRTFAVVTGQQPGFLVAPLYSIYKALQAVRLAQDLTLLWEQPVVPLFWNHADDHDIAEVHHAWVMNPHLDLQKIALAGLASGRQPVSRIVVDDVQNRLGPIREALRQLVGGEEHAERALELFVPKSGETLARAFTRGITGLLGPHGLVVVEPDWIRGALSRELARVVALDPARHLIAGAERVRAAGFEVAIEPREAALVYSLDAKGRRALRSGGDGFRYDGEDGSRSGDELAAEIVQDPANWSPGALLRPIVQDLALPVAAYVGGGGELAYHAELGALRAAVGAPRTPFVPRVSVTLVDGRVRFALERLEASVADILRARGTFAPPGSESPEPAVLAKLRAAGEQAKRELDALRPELAELDPGLSVQLKRTGDSVKELVTQLADKAQRIQANRTGKGRRHERRANNVLFPNLAPQERVFGPLQFVARHGEGWVTELLQEVDALGSEHLVVHLPSKPGEEESA
ncbi:MAG: bacillithiol biosynthesis cysteine-adding enzyme BshC [Planctomycetota bacterium]|nr:bacillithiol biosynthesis cysteine-adding enzyme BshC [Planctomycetota bacterium]